MTFRLQSLRKRARNTPLFAKFPQGYGVVAQSEEQRHRRKDAGSSPALPSAKIQNYEVMI